MLHLLVSLEWKNTEKKEEGNKNEECLVAGHCYDCTDADLSICGQNLHYPVRPLLEFVEGVVQQHRYKITLRLCL